ncbi:MAG: ABC transporter permease [Candidatus Methanomethylophilaceae archaeon]|jgi:ABC-2 type transport system permease protein|nr:ABC transporter permease [Candidatus Methanomethylophilaceae archaeon]
MMAKRSKNPFVRTYQSIKDIYANRVILLALIRRNTAGRYKSTYIGFGWHLLMPVLMIIVLHIVFDSIRARPLEDFWIYLSAGMFPITFISSCLRGRAIQANARYITKMKFPREIVVLASAITEFISVVFAYVVIIMVILLSGQHVNWYGMFMIPVQLALMFIFGYGCSLLVSTVTVFVKDVGYILSVAMRLVFWLTPTFFLISEATGVLEKIVWYNPFTYFVETFHQVLYYGTLPEWWMLGVCAILAAVFYLLGEAVFNRYQSKLPEVL